MGKFRISRKGYISTYKVGEYEFHTRVNYLPLFIFAKLVRIRIALVHPKVNGETWKKSVIVRHSEARDVIQMIISSYLEDSDYFKLT